MEDDLQSSDKLSNNQRTIQSYEGYARKYAVAVSQDPSDETKEGLRGMLDLILPGGTILEVGSGPGWDADFAESLGMMVRRTDVTKAFREFQKERGKRVDQLDILVDSFGGPYDAVLAMCVLLNIDREKTPSVLRKVAGAIRPDGAFLVSIREGSGELWERSEISGDYHVVLWSREEFVNGLTSVGFEVVWEATSVDSDGKWLTFLARKIA